MQMPTGTDSGQTPPVLSLAANMPYKNSTAAIFTPYNLGQGPSTVLLFRLVHALQYTGYFVDILLHDERPKSTTKTEMLEKADFLGFDIAGNWLGLKTVLESRERHVNYALQISLGNTILPIVESHGNLNLYLCQFPFVQLKDTNLLDGVTRLASYEHVLTFNQLVQTQYQRHVAEAFVIARQKNLLIPEIGVWHHIEKQEWFEEEDEDSSEQCGNGTNILLVASASEHAIFYAAFDIFGKAVGTLPKTTTLYLVAQGPMSNKDERYFQQLRHDAETHSIEVIVDESNTKLDKLRCKCGVQWYLPSFSKSIEDPVFQEDTAAMVLKGAKSGIIPIVYSTGPHVLSNTGIVIASEREQVGIYTLKILNNATFAGVLRSKGIDLQKRFIPKGKFITWVLRQTAFLPFRRLIQQTSEQVYQRKFTLPNISKYAVVLVEPRPHFALEYVLKNCFYHLRKSKHQWSLYLMHGLANGQFARQAAKDLENANFIGLPYENIPGYVLNDIMTTESFWKQIQAEKILTVQTDSLVLRGNVDYFLKYDYVGAPWSWSTPWLDKNIVPNGVGNGGFSLRNVTTMLQIIRDHPDEYQHIHIEDVFFATMFHRARDALLPSREEAYKFAIELPCEDIESRKPVHPLLHTLPYVPFGLHKTWIHFIDPGRYEDLLTLLKQSMGDD